MSTEPASCFHAGRWFGGLPRRDLDLVTVTDAEDEDLPARIRILAGRA